LHLDLSIPSGETAGPGRSEQTLSGQVARDVREAASRADSFQAGHVYCYRCEAAVCDHALPPRPAAVFSGYGPTGQPQWMDLAQVLLEARHERVEELFTAPSPLALVQAGRDLKHRLLHPFGKASKRYDLLGQVVAGYFRGGDSDTCAVTVQAVE